MRKDQDFRGIKFASETVRNAYNEYKNFLDLKTSSLEPQELKVTHGDTTWHLNNLDEFLVEYIKSDSYSIFHSEPVGSGKRTLFGLRGTKDYATVSVELPTRESIESIFYQFVKDLDKSLLKPKPKPEIIFIGHGRIYSMPLAAASPGKGLGADSAYIVRTIAVHFTCIM